MTFEADRAKLAFEQASKALASQVATVDNARTRVGVLLGGGNVATAFLGKEAITRGWPPHGSPTGWFIVGSVAFFVFVAACMFALLPRRGWTFDLDGAAILERGEDGSGVARSMDAVHANLAEWSDWYFEKNGDRLRELYIAMGIATIALVVEFVAYVLVLGE